MEPLLYFVCGAVAAASITALICRMQRAYYKQASVIAVVGGTVIAVLCGTGFATLICYFGTIVFHSGLDVFTADFWNNPKRPTGDWSLLWSTVLPCALVSLVVAGFYRQRNKHEGELV